MLHFICGEDNLMPIEVNDDLLGPVRESGQVTIIPVEEKSDPTKNYVVSLIQIGV